MDESDNQLGMQVASNGLNSPVELPPRTQQQYEQSLRDLGRSILVRCRRITSFLCSQNHELAPFQKMILYVRLASSYEW